MEGEGTFESSLLGYADEVAEERIAADDVIMIRGTETTSAVLILRGANDYMLDELERALHESNTVVAGGGAVESALSVYLDYLATTLGSRGQSAIAEFAESLLVIPKVIAYTMSSAITILRIDDMIKPVKDESQNADRGL
ncbi:CHAPERONIN [Salix viminalis]|uniref:CHAPERONIN n=1 Tax=Salix viminalis TaxID=40686 RepID=A0A9Q0UGZ5_SALVM|nr:CHAPERONIN [Salix viminalis]